MMSEILKAVIYASLLLLPCLVAATCASERRFFRRKNEQPYTGPERRDDR